MPKDSQPWWNKKWGKNSVCAITHTRLRPGVDKDGLPYVISLSCGHFFYRKVINAWYVKSSDPSCPICRKVITDDYILEINTSKI